MRAHQLVAILAEHQVAHLTVRLDALRLKPMNRIPKSDTAIGCATAADKETFLMWRPSKGLHGGLVAQEAPHRL